jgi:hypothetical protein
MEDRVAEAALAKLLERDGNGGSTGAKYLAALDKGREMAKGNWRGVEGDGEEGERRRPFSASAVKRIGFDPIGRGPRDGQDAAKRVSVDCMVRCHGKAYGGVFLT